MIATAAYARNVCPRHHHIWGRREVDRFSHQSNFFWFYHTLHELLDHVIEGSTYEILYQISESFPVVEYNGRSYDWHLCLTQRTVNLRENFIRNA